MATFLFVTWDGGGNVPPAVAIGAELRRRGHAVRVLGHGGSRRPIEAAGLDFAPYATGRPFTSQRNNGPIALVGTWADERLGADAVREAKVLGADVVVVDCMLPGAMKALRSAGVGYVVLEHLFDAYLTRWRKGPFGLAMRLAGVDTGSVLDDARLRLVASLPSLDPAARDGVPPGLTYCGPAVTGSPAEPEEPTILTSLSTYAYTGQTAVLQRVLDACADLPARVLVTTGPVVDPAALRLPANAEAHRWLHHAEVMPTASMVIGHGGHSTTMLALAHGLPMLVLPMHPLVDQPMVGRAVQQAAAGRVVGKRTGPSRLRPLVEELLGDGPHHAAAARLADEIRALRGAAGAADHMEALVGNGVPER